MTLNAISAARDRSQTGSKTPGEPAREGVSRAADAWRVLPISGIFEIVYEDRRGSWTSRLIEARELQLGPGRTLLGGIDLDHNLYRGFRADRIRRLSDAGSGNRIETGILDWLLDRAEAQRRAQAGTFRRKRSGLLLPQSRVEGSAAPRTDRKPSV